MCLFEYDQEKHIKMEREGSFQAGVNQSNQLTQYLLKDNRIDDLTRSTSDAAFRQQLLQEYHLI